VHSRNDVGDIGVISEFVSNGAWVEVESKPYYPRCTGNYHPFTEFEHYFPKSKKIKLRSKNL
jgi:hypothetical protein